MGVWVTEGLESYSLTSLQRTFCTILSCFRFLLLFHQIAPSSPSSASNTISFPTNSQRCQCVTNPKKQDRVKCFSWSRWSILTRGYEAYNDRPATSAKREFQTTTAKGRCEYPTRIPGYVSILKLVKLVIWWLFNSVYINILINWHV